MVDLTVGGTVIVAFLGASFAIQLIALFFIARDVRYVGDIQRAILLRTDRTDKTATEMKASLAG